MGGSLTANGVGPMMTFFAGEKQIIKGLPEEIIQRLMEKGYSKGHTRDTTNYISYVTPFNSEGLKLVLDELIMEANCCVLFNTHIGAVHASNKKINSITVCNKDGLNSIQGSFFIDATGDGDVAHFAGVPCSKGREKDGISQPLTMNMKYCNVDNEEIKNHILQNRDKFQRMNKDIDLLNVASALSFIGFEEEFNTAKRNKEIDIPREDILFFETDINSEYIVNTTRIIGCDPINPWDLSMAEINGRKQCAKLDKFLKKYIPGFKNAHLQYTGPKIGVRGSRQVEGLYTLTREDILNQRKFNSTIAHSSYPIDIHSPDGEGTNTVELNSWDKYYNIPYEIMVNQYIDNLIVTGRCVSASFEAQAAIRTTPTVGALGHAAGIAAFLANKNNISARDINILELQRQIIKENGFLDI